MAMAPEATNELVDEGSLPEGLMEQLLSLASKWGDIIDMKTFKMVHMIDSAINNQIYRVSWPANVENVVRTVLVRIYGKGFDALNNRDEEVQNFESISLSGQGPNLLGKFREGRIEEFIHAKTMSASDVRDPETSALIAAKLREFHNLDVPGLKKAFIWEKLRIWISKARTMCTPEHATEFRLDDIEEEIGLLEMKLSKGSDQDIRFCHNDLQCANIMIDEKTRHVTLIDYEFASYNPVTYDIGNYFCEMAANYHSDTPHVLNYNMYPDLKERQRFVRAYLSSTGDEPSEAEVEKLVDDAEKYTLASHLLCGLWGIISYSASNIDFDHIAYAKQRFEQYWLRKSSFLGTTTVIPVIDHVNGFASSNP